MNEQPQDICYSASQALRAIEDLLLCSQRKDLHLVSPHSLCCLIQAVRQQLDAVQ